MKIVGIGDWGLGPIPNPQSPNIIYTLNSYFHYNICNMKKRIINNINNIFIKYIVYFNYALFFFFSLSLSPICSNISFRSLYEFLLICFLDTGR